MIQSVERLSSLEVVLPVLTLEIWLTQALHLIIDNAK